MVDPIAFEHFVSETAHGIDADVMLEAKAKDLALLRLRDQLAARGVTLGAEALSDTRGGAGTPGAVA